MNLYIAGIFHFDPLGRERLSDWMRKLASSKQSHPCFVAVEWSQCLFEQVKTQRSFFRELAQGKWPQINSSSLDVLELSLGYEADTHFDIFNSTTLWLDKGREEDDGIQDHIRTYAKDRLNMYEGFLQESKISSNASQILDLLSAKAIERASRGETSIDGIRDSRWIKQLNQNLGAKNNSWGIAIVGASHADANIENSMACKIKNGNVLNVQCEIEILKPSPGQMSQFT